MTAPAMLRLATPADAAALHAIIAPLVRETHINFYDDAVPVDALRERLERELALLPWVVADAGGELLGYAMAREWMAGAPHARWSVETGLALAPGARGRGLGTRLYRAVLAILTAQGYGSALAIVTRPNEASERLHAALGFRHVGVVEGEGYKLGAWRDTSLWQKVLSRPAAPAALRPVAEVLDPASHLS